MYGHTRPDMFSPQRANSSPTKRQENLIKIFFGSIFRFYNIYKKLQGEAIFGVTTKNPASAGFFVDLVFLIRIFLPFYQGMGWGEVLIRSLPLRFQLHQVHRL